MKNLISNIENEIFNDIKGKKGKKLSEEILSKYFTVKDKTVTVRLNFQTFSELVDQSIGDDKVEKLNSVLFDKISEVFALIPRKYNIDIEICINDFGDYTIPEAEEIVRRNIALFIYAFVLERRRKYAAGLSLLSGGVALLLVSYFLNDHSLPQILFDVINISGTLLVWEAADVALIERGADMKRAKQYVRKFKNISLLQG